MRGAYGVRRVVVASDDGGAADGLRGLLAEGGEAGWEVGSVSGAERAALASNLYIEFRVQMGLVRHG